MQLYLATCSQASKTNIIWGNCSEEGIQRITKVQKLQKRAARIILDAPFFTPTQQLFDSLNWLPFRQNFISQTYFTL